MFDISWGEIAVLGAVGVAVTGKKDLPKACRFVGHQLGRVVGLLQGARARADRFAHHNELRALQNELRSGLRELDQVKTELAVAASTKGVMGRNLGSTTLSANYAKQPKRTLANNDFHKTLPDHYNPASVPLQSSIPRSSFSPSNDGSSEKSNLSPLNMSDFDFRVVDDTENSAIPNTARDISSVAAAVEATAVEEPPSLSQTELSPTAQSERAVMEEEWNKQGIGFKAQAEQGSWSTSAGEQDSIADTTRATGSELLEHLERQCLIFDQYDRVVGEQEAELDRRVERIQNEHQEKKKKTVTPKEDAVMR